jgi:PAS domain S-box-containing protein
MVSEKNKAYPRGLIFAALILFIALGAGLYFLLHSHAEEHKREKIAELQAALDYKMAQIDHWIKAQSANASLISDSPFLGQAVQRWRENPADVKLRASIQSRLNGWQEHFGYSDVLLADQNGNILLEADGTVDVLSPETKGHLQKALATGKPLMTDFYLCSVHHVPHIDIIAPLISRAKKPAGQAAVILRVSPGDYLYPLMKNNTFQGRTFETLLIRRDGDSVLFLNDVRFAKDAALKLKIPLSEKDVPAVRAVLEGRTVVEGRDYRGRKVLAVTGALARSSWFMVAKIDLQEVNDAHRANALIWSLAALLIFAGSVSVLSILFLNQRKDYFKKLYALENERQALVKHFDYLTKYANDIIFLIDDSLKVAEINDRALDIYGYTWEEFIGMEADRLRADDQKALFKTQMSQLVLQKGLIYETMHRRKDGTTFPVEISARSIEIEGKKYLQAIVRDITERRLFEQKIQERNEELESANQELLAAEEELRQSNEKLESNYAELESANVELKSAEEGLQHNLEEIQITKKRYTELFQGINSGVAVYRAVDDGNDFVFVDFNRAGQRIEKTSADQVIGRKVTEVFPGIKPMGLLEVFQRVWRTGKAEQHPVSVYQDEHLTGWRENYVYKLPDGEVVSIYEDMTEIKQVEESLKVSETRYRRLFESAKDGILILNADTGVIDDANPFIKELLGYPREELIGKELWEIGLFKDIVASRASFMKLKKKGYVRYENLPLETKDGQKKEVEFVSNVYPAGDHNVVQCNIRDITQRVQAEELIRNSLKEKEVLLKEIHHRVKNNLQVIASLLNLQTGYVQDERYKMMFLESQNRVRSMALVHEKLYQSRDLSGIDFSEYVKGLMHELYLSYGITQGDVELTTDIMEDKIPVDIAIPCGLIVNELATNSIKYAFKDPQRKGKIKISFKKDAAGICTLEMSDNGPGISEEVVLKNSPTLGLQLVDSLAGQLDAEIKMTNDGGTRVTIKFKA